MVAPEFVEKITEYYTVLMCFYAKFCIDRKVGRPSGFPFSSWDFPFPGCELLETAKKRFLLNLRKSSALFLCKTEKSPRGTPRGLLLFRFYSCAGSAERVMPCCASSRAVR